MADFLLLLRAPAFVDDRLTGEVDDRIKVIKVIELVEGGNGVDFAA